MVEAGGLRTLTIPLGEKPGALDVPRLASRAEDARRFLEETSALTRTGRSEVIGVESAESKAESKPTQTRARLDGRNRSRRRTPSSSRRSKRTATSSTRSAPRSPTPPCASSRRTPPSSTSATWRKENARITSQLSKATRSVSDMRVALNSAVRQVNAKSRRLRCRASAPRGGRNGR